MNYTQQNDVFLTNLFSTIQQQNANRAMLERAASIPLVPDVNALAMNNFFVSLHDLLYTTGGVRQKLERTLSEPINPTLSSRYKTELCRPFEESGECKYVDKCQFAHGVHELRSLQRHPKYKTELCRTFHSVGFCPYGQRCHFIHSSQEALDQHAKQESAKTVSNGSVSPTISLAQSSTADDRIHSVEISDDNKSEFMFNQFSDATLDM